MKLLRTVNIRYAGVHTLCAFCTWAFNQTIFYAKILTIFGVSSVKSGQHLLLLLCYLLVGSSSLRLFTYLW